MVDESGPLDQGMNKKVLVLSKVSPCHHGGQEESLKEPSDKGLAKMKNWVGAYVVSMCGALGDELDFMKCLVRAVHEGVGAYKKTTKKS